MEAVKEYINNMIDSYACKLENAGYEVRDFEIAVERILENYTDDDADRLEAYERYLEMAEQKRHEYANTLSRLQRILWLVEKAEEAD